MCKTSSMYFVDMSKVYHVLVCSIMNNSYLKAFLICYHTENFLFAQR